MNERDIRTAFDHLEEDVMTNVQTDERLEQITKPRRAWARPQLWAFAGAYVAVLVAVGIAFMAFRGDSDPTPAPPASGPATVAPTTVPDATAPPTTGVAPTTQPPTRIAAGFNDVLVTGPDEVILVTGAGAATIETQPALQVTGATLTLGDGQNGLIAAIDDRIEWFRAGAADETLVSAADFASDEGPITLRLEDIAEVGGSTRVFFIVAGGIEEGRYEELWWYDLETGASAPIYVTGAYEGGIARASFQNDVLVVTRAAEGFTWFEFFNGEGTPIDLNNPKPDAAEFPVFVAEGVLSPDAARLLYLESDSAAPPEDANWKIDLVVWDLEGGSEDMRMEIELGNWLIGRMDFNGSGLTLGRIQWDGQGWVDGPALWIATLDADGGVVTDTEVSGVPSLIKVGPARAD